MKTWRNYNSQVHTQNDYFSLFNCHLNLTYEITKITKEVKLDSQFVDGIRQNSFFAEHTKFLSRQKRGKQKLRNWSGYETDTQVSNN